MVQAGGTRLRIACSGIQMSIIGIEIARPPDLVIVDLTISVDRLKSRCIPVLVVSSYMGPVDTPLPHWAIHPSQRMQPATGIGNGELYSSLIWPGPCTKPS